MKALGVVSKYAIATIFAIGAGYVVYTQYQSSLPCVSPIHYKLGTVDAGFGVSRADFLKDIQQSAQIWSDAAHKPLFAYDPKGKLTVNLIYDDRQKKTQQEGALSDTIDQSSGAASSVKAQFAALQGQYKDQSRIYEANVATYNQTQATYNSNVDYWNARGGAPAAEYASLQAQKTELSAQQKSLESDRASINSLGSEINALIDKYNLIVNHINDNVDAYNSDGLAGTQFEEGLYIYDDAGERIDIYQFDSQMTFSRVIAHELGHALGLDHNANPDSIMNPINQGDTLTLSTDDVASLKAQCRLK